jgi:dTDP-4-dehydrorhamnose 3,5-epimerase
MIADMSAETGIEGLLVLRERSGRDGRGVVREFYRRSELAEEAGLDVRWQQINITTTERGAVRGLHGEPMAKLVGLAAGQALGGYVDTRRASPTFGHVCALELSVGMSILVPQGVCNGFQSTGKDSCVYGLDWPIAIDPSDRGQISAKDADLPTFAELYGIAPARPSPRRN